MFIFFNERTNIYCRSAALQVIIWFFILVIVAFPFFVLCIAFGGAFEIIMMVYIGIYIIFRLILIALSVLRFKSERFIAIPPFGFVITHYASATD